MRADGVHRSVREPDRHRTGENRPRLGQRVDLALVARGGAEGRAVVVVAAAVPLAVPRLLERAGEARSLAGIACGVDAVASELAQGGELAQDGVEEEAEPRALAASLPSDVVHAVVPIAAAHQRKAVLTDGQTLV